MANLKPSQWATTIALASSAAAGSSVLAGFETSHPVTGMAIGLVISLAGNIANAVGPYWASIGD